MLLLAGAPAGALTVLLVGWPRGEAAPVEVTPIRADGREARQVRRRANRHRPRKLMKSLSTLRGLVKQPGIVELPWWHASD